MTDNRDDLDGLEEDFADFDGDEFEESAAEDFTDGDEFVEEEWDSFDQEGDEQSSGVSGGKKSSLMLNLIIGLVVLGGAGFVGMKFLGGNAPTQPVNAEQVTMNDTQQQADTLIPPPQNIAADASPMPPTFTPPPSDPELDFEMPMPFSNEMPESDVAQEIEAPTMLSDQNDRMSANDNQDYESEPLTPLPVETDMADMSKGNSFDFDATSTSADRGGASLSSGVSSANQSDVSALESKLDLLFNRLDEIESKVSKSSGGGSYDDSALKASLNKLEKKVTALSDRLASVGTASVQSSNTTSRPRSVSSDIPKSNTTSNQNYSSKAGSWILTSAQPGKATIKKTGQGDVMSVAVGDSVVGLGKILSISMDGDKWVVNATNGKIIQ